MTDPNPGIIWYGLVALLVIGAILDAAIPDKPGRWTGTASADDVARIVAGDGPKPTPRTGAKLGLLLIIAFVLFVMVVGGKH